MRAMCCGVRVRDPQHLAIDTLYASPITLSNSVKCSGGAVPSEGHDGLTSSLMYEDA